MKLKMTFIFLIFAVPFHIFSKPIINSPFYSLMDDRFMIHEELTKSTSKVILINYTSGNCPPCKKEIPKLLELLRENESQGLELWVVFVGDSNEEIQTKLTEYSFPSSVKILKDPFSISLKKMDYDSIPATFVALKNKELVIKVIGYNEESFSLMKNKVIKALGK